jgi:DNA-binding MarR family transcriptional regulator
VSTGSDLEFSTIGMAIVAAHRSFRQLVTGKIVPLGLIPQHAWIILALAEASPLSLSDLARAIRMDTPTMSRRVRELEERGILRTDSDPGHGRKIRIYLDVEGLALSIKLQTISDLLHVRAAKGMTKIETEALKILLNKYILNMDTMVAADNKGVSLRLKKGRKPK